MKKNKKHIIDVIKILKNREDLILVGPNYIYEYASSNNDFNNNINNEWWYNNEIGISLCEALALSNKQREITVGIIDTGVDGNHNELKNNINESLSEYFITEPEISIYDENSLYDSNGHGTNVAGIIAGENVGINKNVKIVSLKCINYKGEVCTEDLLKAFKKAEENNIEIINYSGGLVYQDEFIEKALEEYDGLVICAMGNKYSLNSSTFAFYPADYSSEIYQQTSIKNYTINSTLISVGSIKADGKIKEDSNYNVISTSLFAPGESIYTTDSYLNYDSTNEDSIHGYSYFNGTSCSTAFVTGTITLLLSVNPYLKPKEIKRIIMENVDKDVEYENCSVSGGRLNAFKALSAVVFKTESSNQGLIINGFMNESHNDQCNFLYIPDSFSPFISRVNDVILKENLNNQLNVSAIGIEAFKDNDYLEVIELPNTIKIINNSAFEGCNNLITVNLPNSIENLGSCVFKNCTSIESITLPNSISKINSSLFEGCTSLKEVIIPEGVTKIESSAFKGCTSLERIVLPSTVTLIDSNAFEGCTSLEEIILPSTIRTIGEGAFYGCENLETIDLPNSLENLNTNAFRNCINLKTVNVTKETYPIVELGTNVFTNCPMLTNINVSTDKIIKYKNATNWSSYKNLINCNMEFDSIDICCSVNYNDNITIEKGRDKVIKLNVALDYLYNFQMNSYYELNIKIYDENFNELNHAFTYDDEYVYNIDVPLTEGIYYLDVWGTYDFSSPIFNMKISADIEFDGHELTYNTENNISNHLHFGELSYITYLKYTHKTGKGLYKLSLNEISSSALFDGSIKVYSDSTRTSLVNCYNITNFDNLASSKINENALYLYLNYNTTYYIDITLGSKNSNLNIKIEKIPDVIDFSMFSLDNLMSNNLIEMLDESDDTSLNTSFFKKVNLKESGVYSFTLTYTGTQETDIKVLFIKDNGEAGYSNIGIYTLNNSKTNIYTSYNIINKGTYYIGYYNLDKSICDNLNVSLRRFTDNGIDSVYNALLVDPNAPGMYGSQINIVERNQINKSFGETFITKGFSRLIFIDSSFGYSNSRLDYEWHSSDTSVLTVTQFGTVLGKGIGTAKIVAINKNNPSIIFIKEFTVINNENEEEVLITINQTYSLSSTDNCTLNLTVQNSPYPMIQYYYLVITNCTEEAELDTFGNITVSMPCEITIEGYYLLNSKYKVRINFVVTT